MLSAPADTPRFASAAPWGFLKGVQPKLGILVSGAQPCGSDNCKPLPLSHNPVELPVSIPPLGFKTIDGVVGPDVRMLTTEASPPLQPIVFETGLPGADINV